MDSKIVRRRIKIQEVSTTWEENGTKSYFLKMQS